MGTLRTLFAISVVFAHSLGNMFIGGENAVQLFYMISGFLISYILIELKAYPNIKSFYINRYLRLYPIYLIVALLTFLIFLIASIAGKELLFFKIYASAPHTATILLTLSNSLLFLQDWVMFLGVEDSKLVFSTDFNKSELVLYQALLVPQAWTLGVELSFYAVAPFILSKKRVVFSILIISILLRIYFYYIGLGTQDPWSYRFFPTELALFLLGALAHQLLLPHYKKNISPKSIEKISCAATYFLIAFTIVFSFIPANEASKKIFLFTSFLLLMPLTFIFQSTREWDKHVGNLSYPIYICHMLVVYITTFVGNKILPAASPIPTNKIFFGLTVAILSIFFAVILNKFIGAPVESLRNRYR